MEMNFRNLVTNSGKSLELFDITTSLGLQVTLMSLGAAIQNIAVLSGNGAQIPIALGFSELSLYEDLVCYAGATLAPNAGRIRGGLLPVPQAKTPLSLACNDQNNQLHGGPHNLSAALWKVIEAKGSYDSATVLMEAGQPEGLDGYPGNRTYQVRYTLEDTNWLTIQYAARTDAPTYINMSNHTYWNLSGDFSAQALNQQLTVFSNNVCVNDQEHLPRDLVPVAGTPFDFRRPRSLKAAMETARGDQQLTVGRGYNHAYLLNKHQAYRRLRTVSHPQQLHRACTLQDPGSGRTLKMMTDAPALVLYSGGFLPAGLPLNGGQHSCPSCAIALEAQDVPDIMHLLPDRYQLTTPDRPFRRTIRFHIL